MSIVTSIYTKCLLLVPFLFICGCQTVRAANGFNPELLCTLIANNTKINDPRACNKYITCVNQKPISGTCEGNLFYDRITRNCVESSTVKCHSSNPCAATPGINGFVADPFSCNGYYYCLNGQGTHGNCSSGMNFNPETMNCIRNFPCQLKILPYDYCNVVPDGVFIKVPNTCTSYQTCWRGELLNGTCPDTFYFNAATGECDYPTDVDCVEATTLAPEIPADIKCPKAGVFIADGRSCNGYYYCRGLADGTIEPVHNQCPVERFFDARNGGACVLRTNISCPYNRCITLGYHNIQLANVNNDGCTGFHLCQEGEIIGHGECPSGQYFNELLQLCTQEVVSYGACAKATETTEASNEATPAVIGSSTTTDSATSFI